MLEAECNKGGNLQISKRSNGFAPSFRLFKDAIAGIYSFSPFRKSNRIMKASETETLATDGSNLVQRIFTVKQNEDENWKKLREFVKIALPDLGSLQSRTRGEQTVTVFRDKKWPIEIDIHDMGSGIEQILMIACVLISRTKGSLILIETPEHHLHPGAQRTLLQFIRDNLGENQVLIATHSPIFLGQKDLSMHLVRKTNEGTKVRTVKELDDLSRALSELGSKNSDLLLADYVLFIEGPSDEKIIRAWGNKLGIDFDSKNIVGITISGSRNFDYYANSDVLEKISKSPIPYYFIIDRDEKSDDTIDKIKKKVPNVLVLERREIENYLLRPQHIVEAMREKAVGNQDIVEKLESPKVGDVGKLIVSEANKLRTFTLMKRIGEELGGGTYLPNNELESLIKEFEDTDQSTLTSSTIVKRIHETVSGIIGKRCSKDEIKSIVEKQVSILKEVWAEGPDEQEKKMKVVPGKEMLREVFAHFGLRFDKVKDGERIAKRMKESEIPNEIRQALKNLIDETSSK